MVNTVVSTPPATRAPAPTPVANPAEPAPAIRRSLVAVTACPTGIAHTYMAAEYLETAAANAGVDIHVETQGSAGSTPLDPAIIKAAEAVIFACDVGVRDRRRFAGKPMVNAGVKRAIHEPDEVIVEALRNADDPDGPRVDGVAVEGVSTDSQPKESKTAVVRRVLMTASPT